MGTSGEKFDKFFKSYVCPVLLGIKQLRFCGTCEKVLLEENEIPKKVAKELCSVQCEICMLSYHMKCQNIDPNHSDNQSDWICKNCILSIV